LKPESKTAVGACGSGGIAFALTLAVALISHSSALAQTASLDLLERAANPNPKLESYVASATLSAELHAAIPVRKTFHGTAYYRRPEQEIVFSDASWPWSRFQQMASSAPSYAEIISEYAITPLADDGRRSTYVLNPRKRDGRVNELTLTVDDRKALIVRAVWGYTNGSKLSIDETYIGVGAFRLPSRASISARFPQYSVDGTLELSNYEPNARIPASAARPTSARKRVAPSRVRRSEAPHVVKF
jgi:hypothetical protein